MLKKVLWIGDAGCESGFAKCTHNILDVVRESYDVAVLGINYRGDPHDWPYKIYPCWPGGDLFGVRRVLEIIGKEKPDVIVLQNDPWNIPAYMTEIAKAKNPPIVVGVIAVDGLNCRGKALNKLDRAIFWTEYGKAEALRGGCTVPTGVVGLGVDLGVYKPGDRAAARDRIGLPADVKAGFIVGNVNRNQPRKRLDLTIRYFSHWVRTRKIDNAYLYLHVAPTGDQGYDCDQLGEFYGINTPTNRRLVLAVPEMYHGTPEEFVALTLQAFDVQFTTTQGEGWGLTTLEGMACGIPQILPDWAALGEWAKPASLSVACSATSVTPMANAVGGIMDEWGAIEALDKMYESRQVREQYKEAGIALAIEERFRWPVVGAGFRDQIDRAIKERAFIV